MDLEILNPYADDGIPHHQKERLNKALPRVPAENGLIKFRVHITKGSTNDARDSRRSALAQESLRVHHRNTPQVLGEGVPYVPPDFGRDLNLNVSDSKLFKFCE